MTREEIDKIFPPGFSGLAQISDLRLLLSKLSDDDQLGDIVFFEVDTIQDRDELNAQDGDIAKVAVNNLGNPETYIMSGTWKVLVEIPVGGGGPQYVRTSKNFVVTQLEEDFQEISLTFTPTDYEHIFVYVNGLIQAQGTNLDFNRVGNIIQFSPGTITLGDNIQIKYSYIP